MRVRNTRPQHQDEVGETPRGFDDFALRLGDVMRGERATMGKSLLDVQRELRIKANYIAAIENCDPSAFDTPGFIAGYVRSYARYLGMDPDQTFQAFCTESGFSVAHGMSEEASVVRRPREPKAATAPNGGARDPFKQPTLPFAPANDSILGRIEPGAVGSMFVLIALIGGIGFGGWTVLQEVQRVQVTPVDQTPVVLSDLDPVAAARPTTSEPGSDEDVASAGVFSPPSNEALDRLYRPQALDVPVLVARDAPISTLDPSRVGAFAGRGAARLPNVQTANAAASAIEQTLSEVLGTGEDPRGPVTGPRDGVTMIAVRPAWVRVTDGSGATVFERILNAGDTYAPPAEIENPTLRVGESSAVYLAAAGATYGPVGPRGAVTSDVALTPDAVTERFEPATPGADSDLARVMADLNLDRARQPQPQQVADADNPDQPRGPAVQVLEDSAPGVTILATAETWVLVRNANGGRLYEQVMQAGDSYTVPPTAEPPTIRTGNAGAVFFAVGGRTYGPYGGTGSIADNLALSAQRVTGEMSPADPGSNDALARVVAELNLQSETPGGGDQPAQE
ncbi:helix-turn-helix domain-containing protein [Roseivivax marinus]|uniref:helix-turn-helix domain-containing protein n=1 Tax=Roseivivax marinus TaxID=1379903 RepID=UPI00273F1B07|nr:helix-turn-helix domain-containing protein [Roseivivax marinus]